MTTTSAPVGSVIQSDDPACLCCCRPLSEHNAKRQCPEQSYFVPNRVQIEQSSRVGEGGVLQEALEAVANDLRLNSGAGFVTTDLHETTVAKVRAALAQPPLAPVGDVRSSEDVEGDIRIAIWNAGKNGGMGDDLALAFIRRAMEEPCMQRAIAALQSSPSSHVVGKDAIEQAARYVLENSRRGNASLSQEQFDADTDKLMVAYRDIITKAVASGFLSAAPALQAGEE